MFDINKDYTSCSDVVVVSNEKITYQGDFETHIKIILNIFFLYVTTGFHVYQLMDYF